MTREVPVAKARVLEAAVLSKCETWQQGPCGAFRYFDADSRSVRRGDARGAQHRIFSKDFVVDLGHKIILTIGIAAPDLSEKDGFYGHTAPIV